MAFWKLVEEAAKVAAHGVAVGAVEAADAVTGRQNADLGRAREAQQQHLNSAVQGVQGNADVVGADLGRVSLVAIASIGALSGILSDGAQRQRLVELIGTYDLHGFIECIVHRRGPLPPDFFPNWTQRAGGYFPKLAQILSVRPDLIRDPEVLQQFGRCCEGMPERPLHEVREHLESQGWSAERTVQVGQHLNTGTVAQVNEWHFDGCPAVLKVTFPRTREQMQRDFRLFQHAKTILASLHMDTQDAAAVLAIFKGVQASEDAVMREFDMIQEARTLQQIEELCVHGAEWERSYRVWVEAAQALILPRLPAHLAVLTGMYIQQAQNSPCRVQVPTVLISESSVLGMRKVPGVSLQEMLSNDTAAVREAMAVMLGVAVPFIGWLLLCQSSSCAAHVDPHPGNFRWDSAERTLYVLDWGSVVTLSEDKRTTLCLMIQMVCQADTDESLVGELANQFGVRGESTAAIGRLVRGLLTSSRHRAAPDELSNAAIERLLDDVDTDVVPVVRCLAILGGMLKKTQQRLREEHDQDVALSLAEIWAPWASRGLVSR